MDRIDMKFEISFLRETFLTFVTLKTMWLEMDRINMAFETCPMFETIAAYLT